MTDSDWRDAKSHFCDEEPYSDMRKWKDFLDSALDYEKDRVHPSLLPKEWGAFLDAFDHLERSALDAQQARSSEDQSPSFRTHHDRMSSGERIPKGSPVVNSRAQLTAKLPRF